MSEQDVRWKQRFENFEKAYQQFHHAISAYKADESDDLMRIALIKAFEFTFELAWKTCKDYLDYNGVTVSLPRPVIKQAFANDILEDGQLWIDMLDDRNLMAHTYDEERALKAVDHILNRYLKGIDTLHHFFVSKQKE